MRLERRLDGTWTFREKGALTWNEACVPGCVHSDLFRCGLIEDPFYRDNELGLQELDRKDWEYRLVFDLLPEELKYARRSLLFEGLDTYATLHLNGKPILETRNMFTAHSVELGDLLRPEGNELLIHFRSPISVDLSKALANGFLYPADNDQSRLGGLEDIKISVFARKAPYQYGWDWGPRFLSCGIWKPISIVCFEEASISGLFIEQKSLSASRAQLAIHVDIESAVQTTRLLSLSWGAPDGLQEGSLIERVSLEKGRNRLALECCLADPRLWWCRGQGRQELYVFTAELFGEDEATLLDRAECETGLRSIRLVREPDEWGTSFYLELNGRPVFMKGGNHIPNDAFPARVSPEILEREIRSCVDANFTMIRVWGGGYYEDDEFYRLCDRYGLLVWQDFMFACSMYPGDRAFLESVEEELCHNITRLRNHPSIALWCGNNEMDSAWVEFREEGGWGWKKRYDQKQRKIIWDSYTSLFEDLIPKTLERLLPNAAYWPSSPQANLGKTASRHAHANTTEGDMHYWGVWHQREPFENYHSMIGRFMSEFGFQSFPEMSTIRSFSTEGDLDIDSAVMKAHQKSYIGNRAIMDYLEKEYLPPKSFAEFVYLSQLLQAEGIRTAVEAHRLRRPFCMGSLVWQINDCWPAPSWSSIDYYGNWKALHYYLRDSLADLSLAVVRRGELLEISVLNDAQNCAGVRLLCTLRRFDGAPLLVRSAEKNLSPASVNGLLSIAASELPDSVSVRECFADIRLYSASTECSRRSAFFVPAKDLSLPIPEPIIEAESSGLEGLVIRLSSPHFVKNLAIGLPVPGRFSDNFIDLLPGEPREIRFTPFKEAAVSPAELSWMALNRQF